MPDALLIRPATADDEPFARDCHHRAYRDVVTRQFGPWDEAVQDGFFAAKWNAGRTCVIEVGGEPCGLLDITDFDDELFVGEITVLPERQGRGIGTAVITDLAARGKPMRLQVLHENHRARALYERLGFVEVDRNATHHVMHRPA